MTYRRILALAVLVPLLAACAGRIDSDAASASSSQRDTASYCERNGGFWHRNLGVCEFIRP